MITIIYVGETSNASNVNFEKRFSSELIDISIAPAVVEMVRCCLTPQEVKRLGGGAIGQLNGPFQNLLQYFVVCRLTFTR